MSSLDQIAIAAVTQHPDSHIEMAMEFSSKVCPDFVGQDNDRLVKVGRSLESLVALQDKSSLKESVAQLVEECTLLTSGKVKVRKVLLLCCAVAGVCVFLM